MRYFFLLLSVLAALALGTPSTAREITAADRAEVSARVDAFSVAVARMDMAAVFDFLPPRILQTIADQAGGSVEQLREAMRDAAKQLMGEVEVTDHAMDVASATALKTPDNKRDYLLIPTRTVMRTVDGSRLRVDSQTLAVREDGQWYLMRVQEAAQLLILRQVYPEFTGVAFPVANITVLD